MPRASTSWFVPPIVVLGVLSVGVVVAAQQTAPVQASDHLVAPATFAKLLPAPEGWTKGDVGTSQIDISSVCSYTYATAIYAKEDVRVKLMLADTGAHQESLMALVSLIVNLPDNYSDKVAPATTIKRMKIGGHPAAEIFNGQKLTGEIAVLVGGRFAVISEALRADGIEPLREVLAAVDLKAIAALR